MGTDRVLLRASRYLFPLREVDGINDKVKRDYLIRPQKSVDEDELTF